MDQLVGHLNIRESSLNKIACDPFKIYLYKKTTSFAQQKIAMY